MINASLPVSYILEEWTERYEMGFECSGISCEGLLMAFHSVEASCSSLEENIGAFLPDVPATGNDLNTMTQQLELLSQSVTTLVTAASSFCVRGFFKNKQRNEETDINAQNPFSVGKSGSFRTRIHENHAKYLLEIV